MTVELNGTYPARLTIDYPDHDLNRLSTLLRIFYVIPIGIVLYLFATLLLAPVMLMIVFRQKYPRWWFDFNLQLTRFSMRVVVYGYVMSDTYPSTDEEQSVHLDLDYPNVEQDLSCWIAAGRRARVRP